MVKGSILCYQPVDCSNLIPFLTGSFLIECNRVTWFYYLPLCPFRCSQCTVYPFQVSPLKVGVKPYGIPDANLGPRKVTSNLLPALLLDHDDRVNRFCIEFYLWDLNSALPLFYVQSYRTWSSMAPTLLQFFFVSLFSYPFENDKTRFISLSGYIAFYRSGKGYMWRTRTMKKWIRESGRQKSREAYMLMRRGDVCLVERVAEFCGQGALEKERSTRPARQSFFYTCTASVKGLSCVRQTSKVTLPFRRRQIGPFCSRFAHHFHYSFRTFRSVRTVAQHLDVALSSILDIEPLLKNCAAVIFWRAPFFVQHTHRHSGKHTPSSCKRNSQHFQTTSTTNQVH